MNTSEKITNIIISKLESGVIPWRKTWKSDETIPYNVISGKDYKGINLWTLDPAPYITMKQANDLGGSVKAGTKASTAVFWKVFNDDENDKKFFWLKHYNVFKVSDCINLKNIKLRTPVVLTEHQKIQACEDIISLMPQPPQITHNEARAYYRPSTDTVNVPKDGLFETVTDYYSTVFHELGHSTGSKKRLDRDTLTAECGFGSKTYAKEELVAELCAAMLCMECQIDNIIDNSAAYIKSWLTCLKNDTSLIVTASGRANKAANYIKGTGSNK